MTELIYTKHGGEWIGAVLELDQGLLTRDDYSRLYAKFAAAVGREQSRDFVAMETLYPDQEWRGIYWSETAGRNGMNFSLLVLPGRCPSDIPKLKNKLRQERDVTRIQTVEIKRLVPFTYKQLHADTKP